jgi:hypothetical protein
MTAVKPEISMCMVLLHLCQVQFTMCDSYKMHFNAIPVFLGSTNSMLISGRLHVETGSEKFSMAAA